MLSRRILTSGEVGLAVRSHRYDALQAVTSSSSPLMSNELTNVLQVLAPIEMLLSSVRTISDVHVRAAADHIGSGST